MYIKEGLQLFQTINAGGVEDRVEVDVFDFETLDFEEIANAAQEALLNLIVRRNTLNIKEEELLNMILVPIQRALNGRK